MDNRLFVELSKEYLHSLGLEKMKLYQVYRYLIERFELEPTVENFKSLDDDDFDCIRGVGDVSKRKLIWLRDFLNGKVEGKYEKHIALESNVIKELEKNIELKDEKINKLNQKINELQEENKKIRQENRELRKNDRIIEKLKEVLNCV